MTSCGALWAAPPGPASNSAFRTVALVTSSVAAILYLLTAAAVASYGDRIRVHGWTPARAATAGNPAIRHLSIAARPAT